MPWELSHDGQEFLSERLVVGRAPDILLEEIPAGPLLASGEALETLTCLIVAPARKEELPEAHAEALELNSFLRERGIAPICLMGDDATYVRVSEELQAGCYHIIHICGYGEYDRDNEGAIVLADGRLLTARDIKDFLQGSPLVFLNICESGQIKVKAQPPGIPTYFAKAMGLPFAFMNGEFGRARIVICIPWRIDDVAARVVSLAFYRAFFDIDSPKTVGEALRLARIKAKEEANNATWTLYVSWGLLNLRLIGTVVAQPPPPKPEWVPKKPIELKPSGPPMPVVQPVLKDGRLSQERLSASARQVLHHAELETMLTGADFITTIQLFVGLTKINDGATQAALHHQGFNPEEIRDVLRSYVLKRSALKAMVAAFTAADVEPDRQNEGIGLSKSVAEILRRADQAALDENTTAIEERHLLLGFLSQGGGTTRKPLEKWGVDLAAIEAHARGQATPAAKHPLFDDGNRLRVDRMAPEVRQALTLAWQEAYQRAVGYLATPYLLEALLEEGHCLRAALEAQHLDPHAIRQAVRAILDAGRPRPQERTELRLYDLSRRVQNILRLADEEARVRGARAVAEPHLLLGFLRDGGGATAEALRDAGVNLDALKDFVREERWREPPPPGPVLPPLFLPDGRLKLEAFDVGGRQVLALAAQEAVNIGLPGVDTRRLVLGLAGFPGGVFAAALARQGWGVDRLREIIQGGFGRWPSPATPGGLRLTRRNLSRSVLTILERAWMMADQERASAITERHIARSFLELGGRWTGGGLWELGQLFLMPPQAVYRYCQDRQGLLQQG